MKATLASFGLASGLVLGSLTAISPAASARSLDEQTITDAYVYLLGRALVLRQEHLDISEKGRHYNTAHHNPLAGVTFVNPNLSVTNTQAWIAVDEKTPVVVEIPKIEGRYYTAQICDEWGEVITNINERNYPLQPYGKFAFVAPGSRASVPEDAVRVELRSSRAKMLVRIELQDDPDGAVALQRQIKVTAIGEPEIAPAPDLPLFDNENLIGVELFDVADAMLASAPDVSPVAAQMQAKVRAVARMAADPRERSALEKLLREKIVPMFTKWSVTQSGVVRNNWVGTLVIGNYGSDYWIRTAANLVGIWANSRYEVVYYVTTRDADGAQLVGSNDYVMHFPADALPAAVVDAFWSLTLVGLPDFLPVRNPLDRYNLGTWSSVQNQSDGSMKLLLSPKDGHGIPESNRLPTADGQPFSLTFRTYVPKEAVRDGTWFAPAIERIE